MKRLTVIAVASGLIAALASWASVPAGWWTDPEKARAAARQQGKPIIVDVWATWCAPCKKMDETTWADAGVVASLAGFVPVRIDADVNEVFLSAFSVDVYPTVLVLDADWNVVARKTGFVDPGSMRGLLDRVSAGYAAYREQTAKKNDPEALRAAAAYLAGVGNDERAAALLKRASKL